DPESSLFNYLWIPAFAGMTLFFTSYEAFIIAVKISTASCFAFSVTFIPLCAPLINHKKMTKDGIA
ncbi:MAG: hypothetical protein JXB42_07210, partial [Deltaproteobacteria bacterium]|nr:hypothetical protein [Deltaproteobacteria bacterium]